MNDFSFRLLNFTHIQNEAQNLTFIFKINNLDAGETSFNSDTQLCYIEEDENLERDPMSINDQQSSDGNDNGKNTFQLSSPYLSHFTNSYVIL